MSGTEDDARQDSRFTMGLIADVCEVLDKHGYQQGGNPALGAAMLALLDLTRAYEGRKYEDALNGSFTGSEHPMRTGG